MYVIIYKICSVVFRDVDYVDSCSVLLIEHVVVNLYLKPTTELILALHHKIFLLILPKIQLILPIF